MEAGHTVKVEGKDNDLLERISADPDMPIGMEELEESMEPSRYIGASVHQVERFLQETAAPILEENKELLGISAQINV